MAHVPGQHVVDSDTGLLLHVVERGRGPRLVLVHGVAGSHMVWTDLVPYLEPHFALTMVDLLGYGHSPKPRIEYTPEIHVEAIRRTLRHLGIQPPYKIVGLSMGADLMLEYAYRWPNEVTELVGIGFPYYETEHEARVALAHNAWIRLTLRHRFVAGVLTPVTWRLGRHTAWLFRGRSTLYSPPVAADAMRASYRAFRSSLYNCMVHYRQDDQLDASGEKRRLFIHGDDDQWVGATAVSKRLAKYPNTKVEVIEGPHNLVVARTQRTAQLILGHLGVPTAPT